MSTARPRGFTSFPHGVTRILVRPSASTVILELPKEESESSASGVQAIPETVHKTKLFVALLTTRLLTKCRALDICTEEQLATYAKQLVDHTLQGLTVSDGFCPSDKDIKDVCRAVIKDLAKKLGGKTSLKFAILSKQPCVEAVVVRCLQAHISKHSTVSANKRKTSAWRENFWPVMSVIAICGLWSILAIILL